MSAPSEFARRGAKIIASGLSSVCAEENAKGGNIRFEINPDAEPGNLLGALMPLVAMRLRNKTATQTSEPVPQD